MSLPETSGFDMRLHSFRRACQLVADAFTRSEYEAAMAACQEHVARFPGGWSQEFYHRDKVEALERREAESQMLGLTPAEHEEREQFMKHLHDTYITDPLNDPHAPMTLARHERLLEEWLRRFPADPLARYLREYVDSQQDLRRMVLQYKPED